MGADLYKAVYEDPSYEKFLVGAGVKKPFPRRYDQLSNEQKRNLAEAGRGHAQMLSIGEFAAGAAVEGGAGAGSAESVPVVD